MKLKTCVNWIIRPRLTLIITQNNIIKTSICWTIRLNAAKDEKSTRFAGRVFHTFITRLAKYEAQTLL